MARSNANSTTKGAPSGELNLGEDTKPATKMKWLDGVYSFNGIHYGPSKWPGNYIQVPADFPDDKGGTEPRPEDWRPLPESNVIPAADPNEVL